MDFGNFEIVESSNRVFVAVDLSPIEPPPNCQFLQLGFDFGRPVSMEAIEFLTLPRFVIPLENLTLGISYLGH